MQIVHDLRDQAGKIDSALSLRTKIAVVVAQLVETAECQVQNGSIEHPLSAAKLIKEAFKVMCQLVDRLKTHDDRSALDAVIHPERFLKGLGISRLLFQA